MLSAFDLYIAASAQETFGLSVPEAIASGLPVLYTTCPALIGIQTDAARQVAGSAAAMREEIRNEIAAGPRSREADRNVFACYGAESTVGQIDDLYEQLLVTHTRSGRRRRARQSAIAAFVASAPTEVTAWLAIARCSLRHAIGTGPRPAPQAARRSGRTSLRVATVIARLEGGAGVLALRGAKIMDPDEFELTIVTGSGHRLLAEATAAGLEVIIEPSLRAPISPRCDLQAAA